MEIPLIEDVIIK